MKSSAIKIGNRIYSIASVDDESFDLFLSQRGVTDEEIKSLIDYDDQIILVREKLQRDHKKELILHEIIHSCIEDAGLPQDEVAENFIRVLSPRFACLFEDLPEVLNECV